MSREAALTPQEQRVEVTDADVDRIAEEALADRRTVIRRLAGLPVRGRVQARIDRAMAKVRGIGG